MVLIKCRISDSKWSDIFIFYTETNFLFSFPLNIWHNYEDLLKFGHFECSI